MNGNVPLDTTIVMAHLRDAAALTTKLQQAKALYLPLTALAQMFWTGTGPQPSPGRTETFAFLFDMNQLFEEFIAEFIRRELREVWQSRGSLDELSQDCHTGIHAQLQLPHPQS